MKTLRWIFGFPLAAAIAFGFLYITIMGLDAVVMRTGFYMLRQVVALIAIVIDLVIWVFLTCLFIPSNKRIAGIIPCVCILVFTGWLVWYLVRNSSTENRSDLISQAYFIAGMIASPFIGYGLSYFIFRDKGWKRLHSKKPEKDLAEIYEEEINAGRVSQ